MKKRMFVCMAAMGIAGGMAFSANAETLTWNGARGARWDADAANWLDAGNNPVAWRDGADAVFPAGAFVEVRDSVRPASITFSGNGATLVGFGRIVLPGDLTASVAGTTNSIVVKLVGDATFTKRGAGAVAVGFAKGSALAAEGTLLVAGSRSANLRTTAAGGTVAALGEGAAAASLLANGSFEDSAVTASNGYPYMNGTGAGDGSIQDVENTAVAPWKVSGQVVLANSTGVKTWCGTVVGTGIPDGAQLCILQRFGSIMQEVTVPADGWYDLSFTYYKRGNNYQDHRISLFVDDVVTAALFVNMVQQFQARFSSGPIWLPAGTHAVRFAGEGWEADRATFVDDIRLAPPTEAALPQSDAKAANAVSGNWSDATLWADGAAPSAGGSATASLFFPLLDGLASANDLAGTFLFNSLRFSGVASGDAATLSGNALASRRDGASHGYLTLDTPGALDVSAPLAVNSNLVVDVEGDLTLSGTVSQAGAEGAALEKYGRGTLTVAGNVSNVGRLHVLDGTVEMRNSLSAMNYILKSMTNTAPTVRFDISADSSMSQYVDAFGAGMPTIVLRTGAGRRLTSSNSLNCYGPQVRVDVGEGDTLEFKYIQQCAWRLPRANTCLLKTGPGTLSATEAPTVPGSITDTFEGALGGLRGGINVREGTIRFGADDFNPNCGLANIYTGTVFPSNREGTLGHDTATPLLLGDALTPAGATVGVGACNAHTCSTRTYIATPYPEHVVFSSVSNGVYHMGTIFLRRADFTLGGPDGDVEDVNVMLTGVELDGVSAATITRSGNVRAILNATNYPAGLTLVSDRMLEVGFRRSLPVSIGTLTLSGGWQVSFDAAGHDSVSATNLVLGATEITLWDDVNARTFAQPGAYTLLRYGTLSGDVSSLTVAESCKVPGYGYAIADDGHGAITLTITTATDNPVYTWIGTAGGTWGDASNWDHPAAPNGATAQAVLGPAPQSAATVNLAAPVTLNDLTFYNGNGYTLTGASLSFDGEAPRIFAATGEHEIRNAVTNLAATPISVQSTEEGRVRFAGDVNGDLSVERGGVTLAEGMDLNGNVTVTGATLTVESGVDITGTATLGTNGKLATATPVVLDRLAGADATAEIVVNDTLTLGGGASTFGGTVSGTGALVKDGDTTLTLNGPSFTYAGGTVVKAGTLAVGSALLPGETWLAEGATLTSSGFNHGLTGRYYGYYTAANQDAFVGQVYSRQDYEAMLAKMTFRGQFHQPLATAFSIGDTRENPFASNFTSQDRWAAVYTANLIVPETGLYSFYVVADDECILMIDDCKVLSSTRVGKAVYGGCYLTAGIHTFYLGLFEISGNAYANLYVKQPSESDYKLLPGAWLMPDSGAARAAGKGVVAADAGTVTTVGSGVSSGFDSGFAGSFAAASGGFVQKTGGGILTAQYASGGVAVNGGELVLFGNGAFDAVRTTDDGTVRISGGTIRNLSGDGKAAFGNGVYTVPLITGDADSGFSTNKTYTHLVNFPEGSQPAVINGVTVDNTGSWTRSGKAWSSNWGGDGGTTETGFGRLVYRFHHGSTDFNITLSGLTPGKLYDLRLYFRNFSSDSRRNFTAYFTRGNGEEIGRQDWNADYDAAKGAGRSGNSAIGCRYVAGSDGTVTFRIVSYDGSNSCHTYGFSNELLGDAPGASAVSLTPAAGETARLTGG
ncbi:MAG: autotransporter-associated beta strand repeat-containing protein, partial [Kiritimatiellae bacterium]|nr:autotransporter-associated beta strand repeat-containing protein [Kiritimatiellia bacterium]